MTRDPAHNNAIQPTLSSLLQHFSALTDHRPAPIQHPESLAFKTRFEHKHTSAAVLIPIISVDETLQVLLTRRAKHLRHHPGQISFPGGSCEHQDDSPVATAIRETHEEIGLPSEKIQVLGQLGDYFTVSGYRVTPVVGLITSLPKLTLDPGEVCETMNVPLNFLMDPSNFSLCEVMHEGERRNYYSALFKGQQIWGVTAGIIMALYETLHKEL